MSKLRLLASYISMTAAIAAVCWLVCETFPFVGSLRAQARTPASIVAGGPSMVPQELPRAPIRSVLETDVPAQGAVSLVPVLADPYELATAGVKAATTPEERAAALSLFERAVQNAKLHMPGVPPFQLKVSFAASGNSAFVGAGELTETWFSGMSWRWAASLGGFSLVRIGYRGQVLEDKHVDSIPSRVQMLRNAIFWAIQSAPSNAQLRTAAAVWKGRPVTCVLTSRVSGPAAASRGRLWEEEELCIDDRAGTVQILSVAPGYYAAYSYARNQQYHGRAVPDRIVITMAGAVVVDAQVSLTDADPAVMNQLTPTPEMTANTPVVNLTLPIRFAINRHVGTAGGVVQSVIVHAQITAEGQLEEVDLVAASDPTLGQSALDLVRQTTFHKTAMTQQQAYINVRYYPK